MLVKSEDNRLNDNSNNKLFNLSNNNKNNNNFNIGQNNKDCSETNLLKLECIEPFNSNSNNAYNSNFTSNNNNNFNSNFAICSRLNNFEEFGKQKKEINNEIKKDFGFDKNLSHIKINEINGSFNNINNNEYLNLNENLTNNSVNNNNNFSFNNDPRNQSTTYFKEQTPNNNNKTDLNNNIYNNNNKQLNIVNNNFSTCEQIKFFLNQYDFYLQLLIQNILLTDNTKLKIRCYNLLFTFVTTIKNIQLYYNLPANKIKFNFLKVKKF